MQMERKEKFLGGMKFAGFFPKGRRLDDHS